jgi:hypothetical protein
MGFRLGLLSGPGELLQSWVLGTWRWQDGSLTSRSHSQAHPPIIPGLYHVSDVAQLHKEPRRGVEGWLPRRSHGSWILNIEKVAHWPRSVGRRSAQLEGGGPEQATQAQEENSMESSAWFLHFLIPPDWFWSLKGATQG